MAYLLLEGGARLLLQAGPGALLLEPGTTIVIPGYADADAGSLILDPSGIRSVDPDAGSLIAADYDAEPLDEVDPDAGSLIDAGDPGPLDEVDPDAGSLITP